MWQFNEHIKVVSETFPEDVMKEILVTPGVWFPDVHAQYPAVPEGAHCTRFFNSSSVLWESGFALFIMDDILSWVANQKIEFDLIFAPAQPRVKEFVIFLAHSMGVRYALLEYLPTGRFGDKVVEGRILPYDKALVFNGATMQGLCVGQRLPSFLMRSQGQAVAAAVFAKGITPLVCEAEKMYGSKFYSAIQVNIPLYRADTCPKCRMKEPLIPWTDLTK